MQVQSTFDMIKNGFEIENERYLTDQIITYIGNKRSLLEFIGKGVKIAKNRLGKNKLSCFDVFAGSGIVSRYLKQFSSSLYTNDREAYSKLINECYLTNRSEVDFSYLSKVLIDIKKSIKKEWHAGFISDMYSPKDENNITKDDRVFYTRRNAIYIDTARAIITTLPDDIQKYFLAPLLYGASVHNNTSGVFKGFYKNKDGIGQFGGTGKNALTRILGNIELELPILSNFECDFQVMQMDANAAVSNIPEIDFAYMDPPYNQHPYGSNYFMLNLILNNKPPASYSKVSGIPEDWNRSPYNKRNFAQNELFSVIKNCPAKFILISYNSEGFVQYNDFIDVLTSLGKVTSLETDYNTFRGCRNLRDRSIIVKEYLFLLERK